MKAVILAAGRGSRLTPLTDEIPKGLLEVGGEPIIKREIRLLREYGVADRDIYIVTGYRSYQIEAFWANVVFNESWKSKENCYSVLLALARLGCDDYIFLDSDLVFAAELLRDVLDCPQPNVLSCMRSGDLSESTGIEVDEGGFATRIGKNVKDSGLVYTSLFKVSRGAWGCFREALERPENQGTWYTGAMNDTFSELDFFALESAAAWCEIDDHEDLKRARLLADGGVFL